jgi:hypothetical protein
MPAVTAGKGLPYPLGTDRLMDGDDAIRKLAQSVDNMVQGGTISIPITATNTPVMVSIVFPVAYVGGALPNVTCSPVTNNPHQVFAAVNAPSATGVNIWGARTSGTTAFTVHWVAVGPIAPVA